MEIKIMYPATIPETGLKVIEQLSKNYTDFMCCIIEQNMKRSEIVQEQLNESVKMIVPWVSGVQAEADPECQQLEEIEDLREQIEVLTQKIARLENSSRSSTWNKSGKGHFKI